MEKIDREYVVKVSDLAKLSVSDDEINKYIDQLSDIMGEINKIIDLEVDGEKPFLSPSNNINDFSNNEDNVISKEKVLREANNKDLDYIIVPKVIG